MVEAGLSPRDPARWWLAYSIEQALGQQQQQADRDGRTNIEIVGEQHGPDTH